MAEQLSSLAEAAEIQMRLGDVVEAYAVPRDSEVVELMKRAIRAQDLSPGFEKGLWPTYTNSAGHLVETAVICHGPRHGHRHEYRAAVAIYTSLCRSILTHGS